MLSTTSSSLSAWPARNMAGSFWTTPDQSDGGAEQTESPSPSGKPDDVLNQLLQRNHDEHHIYHMGDDLHFNHLVHHLYVLKALGASEERFRSCFKDHQKYIEPIGSRELSLNDDNWQDYAGKRKYYADFLAFFDQKIAKDGAQAVFERYVPEMLTDMPGAATHPLIHLGYAVEFRDGRVLSEALAATAVVRFRAYDVVDTTLETMLKHGSKQLKFLDVLSQVAQDTNLDKFEWKSSALGTKSRKLMSEYPDRVLDYFNRVKIDEGNVEERAKELFEAATIVYGGSMNNGRLDFFLAHGLTSAHGFSVVMPHLPKTLDKIRLVRTHWLAMLVLYIVQGRPIIDLASRIEPYQVVTEADSWEIAISKSTVVAEEHVPKVVFALLEAERACGEHDGLWRAVAAMTVDLVQGRDDWEFVGLRSQS